MEAPEFWSISSNSFQIEVLAADDDETLVNIRDSEY